MTPVPFTHLAAMAREVWPKIAPDYLACLVDGRYSVRAELARRGTQTGVHYPVPCHQQSPLRRFADGPLPVAERAAGELLSLPMFPHLTDGQVDSVCIALCHALRKMPVRK